MKSKISLLIILQIILLLEGLGFGFPPIGRWGSYLCGFFIGLSWVPVTLAFCSQVKRGTRDN